MPSATDGEDDVEPYYTAKVRPGEQIVSSDTVAAPVPPLPCAFESIVPSLFTGVFGYVYGTGRKSITMLFNKKSPRGIKVVHKEAWSTSKSFALLSFSYSVPLCMLKRLREKEDCALLFILVNVMLLSLAELRHLAHLDLRVSTIVSSSPNAGKNHSVAGAISGFVIAWGNGPVNMLGSSLLLAAVSGYLSRADPGGEGVPGAAHAAQLRPSKHVSSARASPEFSRKHSTEKGSQHVRAQGSQCASITASICPHNIGLLEQAAHYANSPSTDPVMHPHVALAAATVWEAVKPGCRASCARSADRHTDFL